MFPPEEKPLYVLAQKKQRAIIPKIVSLIFLGVIFYVGILINISLLNLKASQETIVKTSSLIILLLVITVGVYVAVHRSNKKYYFYHSKISFNNKDFQYAMIINTNPKQDIFDKMFKTYAIHLGEHFHIRHIPQEVAIQNYLQQLVTYAKQKAVQQQQQSAITT